MNSAIFKAFILVGPAYNTFTLTSCTPLDVPHLLSIWSNNNKTRRKITLNVFLLQYELKSKLLDTLQLSLGGALVFVGINLYMKNEKFHKNILLPSIHKIDPEVAHKLSLLVAKYGLVPSFSNEEFPLLRNEVLGMKFRNVVGMAAGYDKNGEAVKGLFKMGFGFVEVGSITPLPQTGNPKPRVFRLPQLQGVINRYGFNSDGHDIVYKRLAELGEPNTRQGVLGVNLGKNKDSKDPIEDFVLGVRKFGDIADYLVINVSSPNTPGLRMMQQKNELELLIESVMRERNLLQGQRPPIFLKISPDLTPEEIKNITKIVNSKKYKVDGLIVNNTTVSRPDVDCQFIEEIGGLSGKPLKDLSLSTLRQVAKLTKGCIPIIGVGGISSAEEAVERIENGASLVQIYSALVFQGPLLPHHMQKEMVSILSQKGYSNVREAVGRAIK